MENLGIVRRVGKVLLVGILRFWGCLPKSAYYVTRARKIANFSLSIYYARKVSFYKCRITWDVGNPTKIGKSS